MQNWTTIVQRDLKFGPYTSQKVSAGARIVLGKDLNESMRLHRELVLNGMILSPARKEFGCGFDAKSLVNLQLYN